MVKGQQVCGYTKNMKPAFSNPADDFFRLCLSFFEVCPKVWTKFQSQSFFCDVEKNLTIQDFDLLNVV